MSKRKPPATEAQLLERQSKLRTRIGTLKYDLRIAECELLLVDRQLGEINDQHPPGSGRDTSSVP